MKVSKLFILGFFVLFFVGGGSYFAYKIYFGNDLIEDQISNHLVSVAQSKAERVKYFLDQRKDDMVFLSESDYVVDGFSGDAFSPESKMRIDDYVSSRGYLDILFIQMDGEVLYSQNVQNVGIDASLNEGSIGKIYEKVQNDFGVGIYIPGYFRGEDNLQIFVTSPVFIESALISGKKEMIGIVAMQIDNNKIEEKVIEDVGFGDLGEIYIVNREGVLITYPNKESAFIENINTEMYKDCFKEYNNYYLGKSGDELYDFRKSGEYVDYLGEDVYGAHQYMLETGWCVMVEVDKSEFFNLIVDNEKESYLVLTYSFFGFFIILSIFSFVLDRYFSVKNYKSGGKRR